MSKIASKCFDSLLAAAALTAALALFAAPAGATVITGNPGGNCTPTPGDYDGNGSTDLSQLCDGAWHFYSPTGTLSWRSRRFESHFTRCSCSFASTSTGCRTSGE